MPIEHAQDHLTKIVDQLTPGEEILLTRNNTVVASIRAMSKPTGAAPEFGTLKGSILYIAPDFNEIPEGFDDYLP
jgi:antitoxin (DNA-binding transcriptional repressor) of toxin-antitoxin stability system